jgi:hypothetical protein
MYRVQDWFDSEGCLCLQGLSPLPSPSPPLPSRTVYFIRPYFIKLNFGLRRGKTFKIAAFIFAGTLRIKNEQSGVMELSDSDGPYLRIYFPNSIILQETLQTLRAISNVSGSSSSFHFPATISLVARPINDTRAVHTVYIDACLNGLSQWPGGAVRSVTGIVGSSPNSKHGCLYDFILWLCYPLWSSGQSSWLQNGDVLCFL